MEGPVELGNTGEVGGFRSVVLGALAELLNVDGVVGLPLGDVVAHPSSPSSSGAKDMRLHTELEPVLLETTVLKVLEMLPEVAGVVG